LDSPETFILLANAAILLCAYFIVYPRFAGSDLNRLALNDLAANAIAIAVAGFAFFGTGQRFDLLFLEVGWFGFTFGTFLLMELPLFVWYARRYGLSGSRED
jgi:hypothetical protein